MSYRCVNAFEYAGVIYPGGIVVADDHPVIATHRGNFAHVGEPTGAATETATAAPGERRDAPVKRSHPAKKAAPKPVETETEGTI